MWIISIFSIHSDRAFEEILKYKIHNENKHVAIIIGYCYFKLFKPGGITSGSDMIYNGL